MTLQRSLLQCTAFAIGLSALTFLPSPSLAAEKVSIMVGGLEKQIYLPFKLTEILGYFKDEGLEVELLNEPSGVDAEDEMLAGAVQGVGGFYDHCVTCSRKASSSNPWSKSIRRREKSNWFRASAPKSNPSPT
jgi:NitT/TauT family transport system substrate-binding protein